MAEIIKGKFGAPKPEKPKPNEEKTPVPETVVPVRSGVFREVEFSHIFPGREEEPRPTTGAAIKTLFREALRGIASMGIEVDEKLKARMQAMKISAFLSDLQPARSGRRKPPPSSLRPPRPRMSSSGANTPVGSVPLRTN